MMKNSFKTFFTVTLVLLLFTACSQEQKKRHTLDGKALLTAKCASCHNLEMPPETSPDEPAPPMMAVAFHVYDFVKVSTPAEKVPASIAFVKDYVFAPSRAKSFCDTKSLDAYGVMPSQKGKLTADELEAIAVYLFEHYNQENYLKIMKERQLLRDMNPGERLARQNGCLSCHGITHKKMGPSFQAIAKRYKEQPGLIKKSIVSGSQNRWPEVHHAKMPPFKKLSGGVVDTLSTWILEQKQ